MVVYGALVGTLHLVGKTGEILAPTLAPSHPLVLLCLNANDTHMLLTSTSVRLLPYLLICGGRRAVEDVLFFYAGRHHGERATRWLQENIKGGRTALQRATPWFVRAAPLAVVVYPNAAVGVMAGAASMPPLHFVALTLLSIGVRAYAARQAGWWAAGLVEAALQLLREWHAVLTIVATAVALLSVWPFLPAVRATPT